MVLRHSATQILRMEPSGELTAACGTLSSFERAGRFEQVDGDSNGGVFKDEFRFAPRRMSGGDRLRSSWSPGCRAPPGRIPRKRRPISPDHQVETDHELAMLRTEAW